MIGYKHPCRYCDKLVPPMSKICPFCGKVNPLDQLRCPRCRDPIQKGWKICSSCGLDLVTICPQCAKATFFGDYCDHCQARLVVVCSQKKCGAEQPPIGDRCIKCGKPFK